jgi:transcriptional regulator with XRE-family HTH domain
MHNKIKLEAISMYLKRIKDLREDNDLVQKEVAAILGITRQQYNLYENGIREFKLEHIKKIAQFYNVSIDYLFELTNKKTRLK